MNKKINVAFTARDPFLVENIISSEEKEIRGQEYIQYGDRNIYPQYLYNLYLHCPTLQSAINSVVDYTLGEKVYSKLDKINDKDTIEDLIRYITLDYVIYGGFALNILRNRLGGIAQIHHLDFKNVRSNKDNTEIFYSPDWSNKSYGRIKAIKYPTYKKDSKDASSVLYYTNTHIQTYPIPMWGAAVLGAEMEARINNFQLNSIINGFSASYIINLNNGVPSDEVKEEIERNFNEKFCGNENSGRLVIAYNDNKDNACSIEAIPEDKIVEKYDTAVKRAKEQIMTAFRCNPAILGIQVDGNGFNDNDTKESFRLFSKVVIRPIQNTILRALNDLLENADISIEPFEIDFSDEGENNNEIVKD